MEEKLNNTSERIQYGSELALSYINILSNPGDTYKNAPDSVRRDLIAALFSNVEIFVDKDGVRAEIKRTEANTLLRGSNGHREPQNGSENKKKAPKHEQGDSLTETRLASPFDHGSTDAYVAGTLDLCSQFSHGSFAPDALRKLAVMRQRPDGLNKPVSPRRQELSRRLGEEKVTELVQRFEAGESALSLAKEVGASNSALIRMLRAQGVTIPKRHVTDEESAAMAKDYRAGATVREIEAKHGFSHGAVLRSLHRSGVEMRAKAPRTS